MKSFKSIGWVIFLSFSVVFVILTLLLSFIALRFFERAQTDNAANELRVMSFGLVQQVQRYLTTRIELQIKNMTSPGSTLESEMNRFVIRRKTLNTYLATKLKQLPQFKSLRLYDPDGVCVANTEEPCTKTSVRKESFFINGMKKLSYNKIFESADDEEKVLLISAPVTDEEFVVGVLVARVNLSTLYDLMGQELGVGGRSEAFILDSELRFITPSKHAPDALAQSHLAHTPLTSHLNDKLWVGEYLNSKGEEVLGTVVRVPNRRWYLVVERVFSEIQDQLNVIKRMIFLASAALLVVLILITTGITHLIKRPIQSLVWSARRLAEGDYSTPIYRPKGPSEVAFLSSEFERMRAQISLSQGRLKERLELSEQRRIQNERLAAIGTLASTLAHEIRNPLNAMSLLITQFELSSQPIEKKMEIVKHLRGEIGRLDRLVGQILDYAKPINLKHESIDTKHFLDNILSFYKATFEEKKIDVKCETTGNVSVLKGDSDKLRQALVNVIQNSIESFHSKPGKILIRSDSGPKGTSISVIDNGMGIKNQDMNRIYDLFFTTKEKGTGLGLSMVRKIVDAHGGYVDMESQPAAGTRVTLFIPNQIS